MEQLGDELEQLGDVFLEGRTPAEMAILFDWDNWWALEYSAGPSIRMKYLDAVRDYYTAAYESNVPVDIIGVEDEFNSYKIIIAPLLYMTKPGIDKKFRDFVKNGGIFVTTYFSGIVDEHDLVIQGGYPGRLRDILGIWVEENDALPEGEKNSFVYKGNLYPAEILCDLMHLEGAEALSVYEKDFYQEMPVITRNRLGQGYAYYVGTRSNREFYHKFLEDIFTEAKITETMITPKGVEATIRVRDDRKILFLMNHNKENKQITLNDDYTDLLTGKEYKTGNSIEIEQRGVFVLLKINK